MPDDAVAESTDERRAAEDADEDTEVRGAAGLVAREDGEDDGSGCLDEVRQEDHRDHGAYERPAPDERQSLGELREEATPRLVLRAAMRARYECGDETSRDEEAHGVEPERTRAAERRDEHAAERRSDELRPLLDRGADAGRSLHSDVGELDDVREERCPGGRTGRVEQRSDEHEQHELPDLDPDRCRKQRNGRDGSRAREVGDDARGAEAESIDDDAAEEGSEHDRQEVEEDGERGERRAPGRREHEPRDGDLRDGVAGERDRVRDVQRVQRGPPRHRGATLRVEVPPVTQSSGRTSVATAAAR